MCLKPRSIRNPTKYISSRASQSLLLDVPCHNCAECKKQIRDEWRFRTYHEVKHTVSNGGYVYYVTLTYREEDVPKLSRFVDLDSINEQIDNYNANAQRIQHKIDRVDDFYCFDSTDWRNFLKNLRRQLDYHYRGANFKYFLTSEYGTDEDYTHRPHYHVLFFVNSAARIEPYTFSELVSKCWWYGFTDGLPHSSNVDQYLYKDRQYVADHVFGYDLGQKDVQNFMKCAGYVAKYITKDSTFQSTIDKRLFLLEKFIPEEDDFTKLKRDINMFHRQSQGFGLSYLYTLSPDRMSKIVTDGVIEMEDKEKVILTLPLPMYYKRKLFYTLKKDDDGTYYWKPNTQGIHYLEHSIERNIKNLSKRYFNVLLNTDDNTIDYVNTLLDGRSLYDVAKYQIMYRSRYISSASNQLSAILNSFYVREYNFTDLYFRDVDNDTIDITLGLPDLFNNQNRTEINYTSFLKNNIYNENTLPDFKDFDKLLAIFDYLQLPSKEQKQSTFDFVEDLTKKFKHYYEYNK